MHSEQQISDNLSGIKKVTDSFDYTLVAVTKTHPTEVLQSAYNIGLRDFGENKVQEMVPKHESLPEDIRWHFIGHLQRNKVKFIAPIVYLIHSVDSLRLLKEINKQGEKNSRIIRCLLQMHIAREETKFGLSENELSEIINGELSSLKFVHVEGLMGMATNTEDESQVRSEFRYLKEVFDKTKEGSQLANMEMKYLSMGMSQDYRIALEEGSNMVRIGSTIFGPRNYPK